MDNPVSTQPAASRSFWEQPNWWYKPLIWAVFLTVLYLLREFFLIGFLTFLICYIVRGLVGFLMRRMTPARDSHWLELILTLSIFLGICLGIYGIGRFFAPQVIREGKSLAAHLQNMGAAGIQNSLLSNSVGAWKFQQQFGSPADQRYEEGLKEYQTSGRNGEGLYKSFPELDSRLQAEFEASYEQSQIQHLESFATRG